MGDDAAQPQGRPGPGPRHRRGAGSASSTLTPPIGIVPVPGDPAPASPAPPVAPVRPDAAADVCVCLHGRAAHEHYRRGSDCGVCGATGCAAYRRRRSGMLRRMLRRVLRRLGLVG